MRIWKRLSTRLRPFRPNVPHPSRRSRAARRSRHLPRRDIPHEPDSTVCSCGCQLERIGEEISERLDYQPGSFEVERHVRGKWVCRRCETLIQAPIPAQIIDKGIPSAGLLGTYWCRSSPITRPCTASQASWSAPRWQYLPQRSAPGWACVGLSSRRSPKR